MFRKLGLGHEHMPSASPRPTIFPMSGTYHCIGMKDGCTDHLSKPQTGAFYYIS